MRSKNGTMKKITTLFSVQGQSGQPMNALLIGRLTGIVLIVCFALPCLKYRVKLSSG